MREKILKIHCKRCKTHLFSYVKIGKGSLIRCWKKRIINNNYEIKAKMVYCTCGNIIGQDKILFILIKKHHIKIH